MISPLFFPPSHSAYPHLVLYTPNQQDWCISLPEIGLFPTFLTVGNPGDSPFQGESYHIDSLFLNQLFAPLLNYPEIKIEAIFFFFDLGLVGVRTNKGVSLHDGSQSPETLAGEFSEACQHFCNFTYATFVDFQYLGLGIDNPPEQVFQTLYSSYTYPAGLQKVQQNPTEDWKITLADEFATEVPQSSF